MISWASRRSNAAIIFLRPEGERRASLSRPDEIAGLDLAVVDRSNHHRVGQDRPERLHHVERQRRPAVARLVIKAAIRVEADRRQCRRQLPYQHRVGEGQHRVNRIGRRTSVAVLEFETRQLAAIPIAAAQHRAEAGEINGRTVALDAEEFAEVFRLTHCASRAPEPAQSRFRRRVLARVAAQQGSAVAQLGGDQSTRQAQAERRVEARSILRGAELDIAMPGADRVAEKPATARNTS